MPNYGVANIIEVVALQSMDGQDVSNVFYVRDDLGVGITAATIAVANELDTFYNAVGVHLSSDWSVQSYTGTEVDTDTPQQSVITSAVVGDLADAIIPRQVALVCSWRTAFIGPRRRGRSYLVGFTEAGNMTDGTPTAAVLSDVITAADALHNALDAEGVPMVVLSRGGRWTINGHIVDPDPPIGPAWVPFATNVTGVVVDARWDTQRRRRL